MGIQISNEKILSLIAEPPVGNWVTTIRTPLDGSAGSLNTYFETPALVTPGKFLLHYKLQDIFHSIATYPVPQSLFGSIYLNIENLGVYADHMYRLFLTSYYGPGLMAPGYASAPKGSSVIVTADNTPDVPLNSNVDIVHDLSDNVRLSLRLNWSNANILLYGKFTRKGDASTQINAGLISIATKATVALVQSVNNQW